MIRNIAGSVLALAGATAAVWSPFRAWYDGRHGRDYAIDELFTGITDAKADLLGSMLAPFLFAALLTLLGVVLRSRLLVALAGLVVLGFTVLWMVRVGQAEGSLTVGGDGAGLGDGVANAFGGGVLLLLGALVMSGRSRPERRVDHGPRPTHPTLDGPPAEPHPGPHPDPAPHPQQQTPAPYAETQTYDVPAHDPDRDRDHDPDRDRENPPPRS
ncbi:hypothetical protein DEJ45_20955 [Streptomyces venezuelae]|uniref:hypothetical protein n=1 Tax=Streptomyces venezuelae TaxID=54571 RepID=UPI00123D454B|nr:hypothetical protein [Streptomyces venezuelae]QES14617.1 hypothetical protein DEJ45_20955 [Streptomyces venezuelae]